MTFQGKICFGLLVWTLVVAPGPVWAKEILNQGIVVPGDAMAHHLPTTGQGRVGDPTGELLGQVMARSVSSQGWLDIAQLKVHPRALFQYSAMIRHMSPDTQPGRFPTEESRLAYWLNVYHGQLLYTMVAHYPLQSWSDVPPKAWARTFVVGGQHYTLARLRERIVGEFPAVGRQPGLFLSDGTMATCPFPHRPWSQEQARLALGAKTGKPKNQTPEEAVTVLMLAEEGPTLPPANPLGKPSEVQGPPLPLSLHHRLKILPPLDVAPFP